MDMVNVHEAKTHLSRLLQRVSRGEEIVIAKDGQPIAKLIAVSPTQRQPGRLKGKIRMGKNFDAPLPRGIAKAFGMTAK
ncbi:MAG TPA: type II toxin-antitoxin system prevent-host-death family antitoxin [Candidatus Margulisiibacteriota bacterium]|nr:type II toxin-antitoxin system prevent-host-death family antitoxin [Candidatus Margulisiibacteriota bacterium]